MMSRVAIARRAVETVRKITCSAAVVPAAAYETYSRSIVSSQNHQYLQYDISKHQRKRYMSSDSISLTPEQRSTLLDKLVSKNDGTEWTILEDRDAITKTYNFIDFNQAWKFMSKVAVLAEELNHHPEWFNVYNRVEVTLTTHDCNGLSTNDIQMAQKMDELCSDLLSTNRMAFRSDD